MTIDAHLHRLSFAADQAASALTLLTNGRHAWAADVERTLGSIDAAPSPHAERARLLEIAGKCPIHRVLEGQTRIETTLG